MFVLRNPLLILKVIYSCWEKLNWTKLKLDTRLPKYNLHLWVIDFLKLLLNSELYFVTDLPVGLEDLMFIVSAVICIEPSCVCYNARVMGECPIKDEIICSLSDPFKAPAVIKLSSMKRICLQASWLYTAGMQVHTQLSPVCRWLQPLCCITLLQHGIWKLSSQRTARLAQTRMEVDPSCFFFRLLLLTPRAASEPFQCRPLLACHLLHLILYPLILLFVSLLHLFLTSRQSNGVATKRCSFLSSLPLPLSPAAAAEESLNRVSPAELNTSLPGLYGLTLAFPSLVHPLSLFLCSFYVSLPSSLSSAAVTCQCQPRPSLFSVPLSVLTHPHFTHTHHTHKHTPLSLPSFFHQLFHLLFLSPQLFFFSLALLLFVLEEREREREIAWFRPS